MYFGSTIMTFALPFGAFIVATIALYYLFRARHSGPRLRWSAGSAGQVASVTTREPGPVPAPDATTAMSALPVPTEQPVAPASDADPASDSPPDDGLEGKDGEQG